MGGISSQALVFLLILSPGFLVLVGFYLAQPRFPTRLELQRGVVIDTALFVVVSAVLHSTFGLAILYVTELFSQCSVVKSLSAVAGGDFPQTARRCSIDFEIVFTAFYSAALSIVAYNLGTQIAGFLISSPKKFAAIYGQHYAVGKDQTLVIANVLTKTVHEGNLLGYEGALIELSLTSSKTINYVCLEAASRFCLSLEAGKSHTTNREDFISIDGNHDRKSRLTIPGEQVLNLVTRTYSANISDALPEDLDISAFDRRGYFLEIRNKIMRYILA